MIILFHSLLRVTARLQYKCAAVFSISNASHHSKGSKFQIWRKTCEASMSSISSEDDVELRVT